MVTAAKRRISIPVIGTDIDVARVAAVMNLLAANLAAPTPVSMSFWASDYPDGALAFKAFAAQHSRDVKLEERADTLYLDRPGCGIATFYSAIAEERAEQANRERREREGAQP